MSKADEIFFENDFEKTEKFVKNELQDVTYKTDFKFVENTEILFDCIRKMIFIKGAINIEILQAINEKVKELGWNE